MAKARNPKKPAADVAKAAQAEAPKAGQKFKVDDRDFVYVIAKFNVPGIGERTSLEASTDDTLYPELGDKTINEFLVAVGAGVIEEA